MGNYKTTAVRGPAEMYPDFTAEIEAVEASGISEGIVRRIIRKHQPSAAFNKRLYDRYCGVDLPIFQRTPRFEEEKAGINNKIANDFFGEIIDFKTGYFAGKPIGYSYSVTDESERNTSGGVAGVNLAAQELSDFVLRNNMFDTDMECAKYASCCGYAARLFYIDTNGKERVMNLPPYETAILSKTDLTEPCYGVRYYSRVGLQDELRWFAEFYDSDNIWYFEGDSIDGLMFVQTVPHLFDGCPVQGVPNNAELLGDAEKVMTLVDAYDRAFSDANNEIESFANAYMVFENIKIDDKAIVAGQKTGAFQYMNGGSSAQGKIYFVTKDVNDGFIEHHLNRLENNIYRFSKTPNLGDKSFSQNSSGVALKFKLTGLETKCGMFEAKMRSAGTYMFGLLASAWKKKGLVIDPLECVMEFHRNFPLDLVNEAQAVGALVSAGLPERVAFGQLSFVDDVEYLMQLKQTENQEEKRERQLPVQAPQNQQQGHPTTEQ